METVLDRPLDDPTDLPDLPDAPVPPRPPRLDPPEDGADVLALAVDVGHRRVRVAVVDLAGTVRARADRGRAPRDDRARARLVGRLARACLDVLRAEGVPDPRLRSAVVGVPAVVLDGTFVRRVPGHEKGGPVLHDALEAELGCPVVLENDANLAALAEQRLGAGRDEPAYALLTLGVGLGAGLVLDGRLHRGVAGGAGEIGFLPQPGLPLGAETLGAASVALLAEEAGLPAGLHPDDVVALAEDGDARAHGVLDALAERLALVVAAVTLVVEPGLFVLGGSAAHPEVVGRVRRYLHDRLRVLPVRVEAATVPDPVLEGASGLARQALGQEPVPCPA